MKVSLSFQTYDMKYTDWAKSPDIEPCDLCTGRRPESKSAITFFLAFILTERIISQVASAVVLSSSLHFSQQVKQI